jgi:hypothetical protein
MRPGHHRLHGLFGIQSACVAPRSRLRCAIVHDGAEMRTPPLNVHEVVGGQPLIVRHDELVIRIGRHAKAAGLEVDRQWQRRDRKHADASRYLWLLFLISGLAIGLFIGRIRGAALVEPAGSRGESLTVWSFGCFLFSAAPSLRENQPEDGSHLHGEPSRGVGHGLQTAPYDEVVTST